MAGRVCNEQEEEQTKTSERKFRSMRIGFLLSAPSSLDARHSPLPKQNKSVGKNGANMYQGRRNDRRGEEREEKRSKEKRVVRAERVPSRNFLHQLRHEAAPQLNQRRQIFQMSSRSAYREGRGGERKEGEGEEWRGKKAEERNGNANFAIRLSHALK